MKAKVISSQAIKPHFFKHSKTKIWLRSFIALFFGIIFSISLYSDLKSHAVSWVILLLILFCSLLLGFWMSNIVPMEIHPHYYLITLSFDRIYFTVIFILVGIKFIASQIQVIAIVPDGMMVVIIGLMFGRLSGICLWVHKLKLKYNFFLK